MHNDYDLISYYSLAWQRLTCQVCWQRWVKLDKCPQFCFPIVLWSQKKKKNRTDNKASYEKLKELQLAFQLKPRKISSNSQKLDFYIGNRKLVKHGKSKKRTWLTTAKIKRMFVIELIKSCWWLHLNCHLEILAFFNQKSFSLENHLVTSFVCLFAYGFLFYLTVIPTVLYTKFIFYTWNELNVSETVLKKKSSFN